MVILKRSKIARNKIIGVKKVITRRKEEADARSDPWHFPCRLSEPIGHSIIQSLHVDKVSSLLLYFA